MPRPAKSDCKTIAGAEDMTQVVDCLPRTKNKQQRKNPAAAIQVLFKH
jgi:hypothetical protein